MREQPDDELTRRLESLLGSKVASASRAVGGYTPAERWVVRLASGRSVFAKAGTTELTARCLRTEHETYQVLKGEFMPELLAWDDDPERPLLVLEDLQAAHWPPPWTTAQVDEACRRLEELHALRAPLRPFSEVNGAVHGEVEHGWRLVERDPEPFLGLGLVSERWLEETLPTLVEQADRVALEVDGPAVTHFDVRSDNLCFAERGMVLVDWNFACLGNARLDTGFWLPSLHFEGGPPPEQVLPEAGDIAAWVSGFFAARAGLAPIPDAPRVRRVQQEQLSTALPWVVRELRLPPLAAVAD
ncbi:MAG: hypothetical protein AAF533_21365 [Acidobacteriota bacterium]